MSFPNLVERMSRIPKIISKNSIVIVILLLFCGVCVVCGWWETSFISFPRSGVGMLPGRLRRPTFGLVSGTPERSNGVPTETIGTR
jgi:hypothetical protein